MAEPVADWRTDRVRLLANRHDRATEDERVDVRGLSDGSSGGEESSGDLHGLSEEEEEEGNLVAWW
jgi:hypothetical protein